MINKGYEMRGAWRKTGNEYKILMGEREGRSSMRHLGVDARLVLN
jgi:hypothetical protein